MNSIEKLKQAIPQVDSVALNLIRTDGETQYRENIDEGVVRDYLDAMKDNVEFPPIEAVFDGEFYWLTDGFHRLAALNKLGIQRPEVSFISGTKADAQLLALSANGSHGLPRSMMTKHRIGLMAISHPALQNCSNYEIAKFCGLSAPFIQSLRNPSVKLRQQDARDRSALKRIKLKVSNPITTSSFAGSDHLNESTEMTPEDLRLGAMPDDLEMQAAERALQADQEAMYKLLESDDALAHAHEEIKRLNYLNAQFEVRMHGLMNERNEAVKQIKKIQRENDRLIKQLRIYKTSRGEISLQAEVNARQEFCDSLKLQTQSSQ